jgi:hypothetical protein
MAWTGSGAADRMLREREADIDALVSIAVRNSESPALRLSETSHCSKDSRNGNRGPFKLDMGKRALHPIGTAPLEAGPHTGRITARNVIRHRRL